LVLALSIHNKRVLIRENPNYTILPLDSGNQESEQIPGFWNPIIKWCDWDFLLRTGVGLGHLAGRSY
jgi:hypothetical protein